LIYKDQFALLERLRLARASQRGSNDCGESNGLARTKEMKLTTQAVRLGQHNGVSLSLPDV